MKKFDESEMKIVYDRSATWDGILIGMGGSVYEK